MMPPVSSMLRRIRSGYTTKLAIRSVNLASMKSTRIVLSGIMTRSTDEWLMSRSCQRVMFSMEATQFARTIRAKPQRFSETIGLRLCGMAEEPFWPGGNGSSASSTSVRCRWRISVADFSMLLPGAVAEHGEEPVQVLQNGIGGLDHQNGQRGVQDIGGGQAQVQVADRWPDLLGNGFDEGNDVVLRDPLQRLDTRRVDAGLAADLPDCRSGDQPFLRQSLAGQKLHLQPRFIFARRLPDRFQERPGIAINHGSPT